MELKDIAEPRANGIDRSMVSLTPVYDGGFTTYGFSLGILILDARYPRVPGDLGNGTTFTYPVVLQAVPNATPRRVVDGDASLLDTFVAAARDLEQQGVKAITTSCGFLAVFQKEMASAVRVPVFTSSLIQVPLVQNMLGRGRRVGILTADGSCLTEAHFEGVGWSSREIPVAIQGMEPYPNFTGSILNGGTTLDFEAVAAEMEDATNRLVRDNPDVGAIVLECTNMPPYAAVVQAAIGLPVFDILTLSDMVYRTMHRVPTAGPMPSNFLREPPRMTAVS